MLGTVLRLSTRIVSNRRLCARTGVLALLAALLIAAPAHAEPLGEQGSETLAGGPPAESGQVVQEGSGPAPSETEGQVVQEGSGPGPSGTEGQVVQEGGGTGDPSPSEGSGEAPLQEPAPPPPEVETAPSEPPPPPAAEDVAETPPPPAQQSETPAPLTEERTTEPVASEAPAHLKADEKGGITVLLPTMPGSGSTPAAGATGEGAADTLTGAPTGAMVINLNEATVGGEGAAHSHTTAAARAGHDSGPLCDIPGIGGPAAAGCATILLGAPGQLTPSGVGLVGAVTVALAAATTASGTETGDRGGAAGGGRPMPTAPGPAPGGASGGAAGGAGGGVGLPGFLAFAVLLALAAPRAMRHLRLACQPWRTAFFVLIPERPG